MHVEPEPPPVPEEPQVDGPALLPPTNPPLEVPSQQVPNEAQELGQAVAPSSQRPLVQWRVFTGGPLAQSQYQ